MAEGLNLFFSGVKTKDVVKKDVTGDPDRPLYTELELTDDLTMPWTQVRDMSEKDFEVYAKRLRLYFLDQYENKHYGIGGGDVSLDEISNRLQKFNGLDVNSNLIYYEYKNNKILKGYNTWASVIDHWFPEMCGVEISSGTGTSIKPSILGLFQDEKLFMTKIKRILWKDKLNGWKKEPTKPVWPTLKQSIRMGGGTQPVTNIRGPVAKWIWQTEMLKHKDLDEIIVYDPSMGWAGRLIAFLAATNHPELKNKKCIYVGTDPNSTINPRYKMIERFWKKYIDPTCKAEVYPLCLPAEDIKNDPIFKKIEGKVCVCYTSPPYFNRERYSDDPEQSYKRYKEYGAWRDGFLDGTIKNCYDMLIPNGKLFWNTANLKISKGKFLPLEIDSVKKAKKYGFTHEETIKMEQRFTIGRDNNLEQMAIDKSMNIIEIEGKLTKFEPVLIFKK